MDKFVFICHFLRDLEKDRIPSFFLSIIVGLDLFFCSSFHDLSTWALVYQQLLEVLFHITPLSVSGEHHSERSKDSWLTAVWEAGWLTRVSERWLVLHNRTWAMLNVIFLTFKLILWESSRSVFWSHSPSIPTPSFLFSPSTHLLYLCCP